MDSTIESINVLQVLAFAPFGFGSPKNTAAEGRLPSDLTGTATTG